MFQYVDPLVSAKVIANGGIQHEYCHMVMLSGNGGPTNEAIEPQKDCILGICARFSLHLAEFAERSTADV